MRPPAGWAFDLQRPWHGVGSSPWQILANGGEEPMKSLRHLIAVAAVAFALPAQAGINDPEVLIYRVSGVIDNGGFGTTVFCTNFSGVDERIRIAVRDKTG